MSAIDSDEEKEETVRGAPPKGIVKLLDYLYIGDVRSSEDAEGLKFLDVKLIVNCCAADVENHYEDAFEYVSIDLTEKNLDFADTAQEVFDKVSPYKESSGSVLIHCTDGYNYSPSLAMAYMLFAAQAKGKNLTLQQALRFVQQKHKMANPSMELSRELIALEKEMYGEASIRLSQMAAGVGKRGKTGKRGRKSRRGH